MLIINEFLFDGHLIKSLIFAKKILIIKEFLFDGYLIELRNILYKAYRYGSSRVKKID